MSEKRTQDKILDHDHGHGTPILKRICVVNEDLVQEGSDAASEAESQNIGIFGAQAIEAENGIIERVTIKNFMCHTYLSLDIGPNVNLVFGRNGSGKSAILKAIVICLGGKSSRSGKDSSNLDFIKDTCRPAVICVQLKNQGSDAFKPDQYDASILIERTIHPNETGSLNIQAKNGSVISTKQQELENILYHFNIEIDNTVSILNQDTIHNVMCTSDSEKGLYKIFLKALRLEKLSDDYPGNEDKSELLDIRKVVERLLKMEDDLDELTTETEEANRKATANCEQLQTKRPAFTTVQEHSSEKELRTDQQRHIADTLLQLVEAKERLITVLTNMGSFRAYGKKLEELLKQQEERNRRGLSLMGVRIRNNFRLILSECGYSGKIKLDHDKQQLNLLVDCNPGQTTASKNSRILSVGERSFSIIAFFMALWDSMETPFRCLDEFNGFLDTVNRKIIVQIIMKLARQQTHRQFILLTTQDMSDVDESRYVKIFRLREPERYRTANVNSYAAK